MVCLPEACIKNRAKITSNHYRYDFQNENALKLEIILEFYVICGIDSFSTQSYNLVLTMEPTGSLNPKRENVPGELTKKHATSGQSRLLLGNFHVQDPRYFSQEQGR